MPKKSTALCAANHPGLACPLTEALAPGDQNPKYGNHNA